MPITDYSIYPPTLVPGIITSHPCAYVTRYNRTNAIIPFGVAIAQSPDDVDGAILPNDVSVDIIGISARFYIYENKQDSMGQQGYGMTKQFDILEKGEIAVHVESEVMPGAPVFFRHATNGQGKLQLGAFRTDADEITVDTAQVATCTQLLQARWISKTTGAGLALLSINLP